MQIEKWQSDISIIFLVFWTHNSYKPSDQKASIKYLIIKKAFQICYIKTAVFINILYKFEGLKSSGHLGLKRERKGNKWMCEFKCKIITGCNKVLSIQSDQSEPKHSWIPSQPQHVSNTRIKPFLSCSAMCRLPQTAKQNNAQNQLVWFQLRTDRLCSQEHHNERTPTHTAGLVALHTLQNKAMPHTVLQTWKGLWKATLALLICQQP